MNEPQELCEYTETELLGLVATILSEPGELNQLGHACLAAINSEFVVREMKKLERKFDA
jgi:hypothetical protein